MTTKRVHEVAIFHDETKRADRGQFKGHVLLFIPQRLFWEVSTPLFGKESGDYSPSNFLYSEIMKLREIYNLNKKLHFSDISGKQWGKFDQGVRQIVELGVDSLRHKRTMHFSKPLCCKVAVIFYPRKTNISLYGGEEKKERGLRYDETVFRMLLKGAVHYLFDPEDEVVVTNLVSDGQPNHRPFNPARAVWRITYDDLLGKSQLREYVRFEDGANIIHMSSDHKQYFLDSIEFIRANFLQLADLLFGSIIRSCYQGVKKVPYPPRIGSSAHHKKDAVAYPVKEMINKQKRGRGFIHSGHHKAFTISQLSFQDDEIQFSRVDPRKINIEESALNLSFL